MSAEVKYPVGAYCMHRMHGQGSGTLVRIENEKDSETRGRVVGVEYVQMPGITCGGYSSSWPESDLTPITDPELFAAARCYDAQKQAVELRRQANEQDAEAKKWRAAAEAIRETKKVLP